MYVYRSLHTTFHLTVAFAIWMTHHYATSFYIVDRESSGRRDNSLWSRACAHKITCCEIAWQFHEERDAQSKQEVTLFSKTRWSSERSNDFSRPTFRVSFTMEASVSVLFLSSRSSAILLASSFTCPARVDKSNQWCKIVTMYRSSQVHSAGKGVVETPWQVYVRS